MQRCEAGKYSIGSRGYRSGHLLATIWKFRDVVPMNRDRCYLVLCERVVIFIGVNVVVLFGKSHVRFVMTPAHNSCSTHKVVLHTTIILFLGCSNKGLAR